MEIIHSKFYILYLFFGLTLLSCKEEKLEIEILLDSNEIVCSPNDVKIKSLLILGIESDTIFYAEAFSQESLTNKISGKNYELNINSKSVEFYQNSQIHISGKFEYNATNYYINHWFKKGEFSPKIKHTLKLTR